MMIFVILKRDLILTLNSTFQVVFKKNIYFDNNDFNRYEHMRLS